MSIMCAHMHLETEHIFQNLYVEKSVFHIGLYYITIIGVLLKNNYVIFTCFVLSTLFVFPHIFTQKLSTLIFYPHFHFVDFVENSLKCICVSGLFVENIFFRFSH